MCFLGRVKSGWYGYGRPVANGTVTSALTSVSQAFSVDDRGNPLKPHGSKDYHLAVKVMLDEWKKEDPPTMKKLPIKVDIPEYLVGRAMEPEAGKGRNAIADLTLIAFYYLLHIGEYTCRTKRNNEKQTVQFRIQDVTFFKRNKEGRLKQMSLKASAKETVIADSCTVKISNQKNGWRGICINHHANGDPNLCTVKALARWYVHIKANKRNPDTFLSTYWENGGKHDVTDGDIRKTLKLAAVILDYPEMKGILIN